VLIYAAFSLIALTLIGAAVLGLGWVEDLAARRPAKIWPFIPPPPAAPPAPAPAVPALVRAG
jgi:hypothetical protein